MNSIPRKKVLLVLPRGEAVRNFVLSGTAAVLRKEAEVHIVSVVPNKEIEKILIESSDSFSEIKIYPEKKIVTFLIEWLDVIHGRWLWSEAAKNRWMMRDHEANTLVKKIKRFGYKAMAFPFINRFGVGLISKVEHLFSERIYPVEQHLKFLRDLKPDLVFNGSHIHCRNVVPLMHAAKTLGIKTATFLFSWDNLTSQGRILPMLDYYLVWNEQIKKQLLEIYHNIDSSQVLITGTPQFDFHFQEDKFWTREDYCKKMGLDPNRPVILYTTGMAVQMPAEHIIVENIADMCLRHPNRPQLIVRVYPKDRTGRFEPLQAKRPDICFPQIPWDVNHLTPMPEDLILWPNMLKHCELGINIASTVALELCMFDKPSLNVGYNPPGVDISPVDIPKYYGWDHYKPIVDSGGVSVAFSEAEMEQMIHISITQPEFKREERKNLIKKFFGNWLDGKSYHRIAEEILKMVE